MAARASAACRPTPPPVAQPPTTSSTPLIHRWYLPPPPRPPSTISSHLRPSQRQGGVLTESYRSTTVSHNTSLIVQKIRPRCESRTRCWRGKPWSRLDRFHKGS